MGDLVKKQSDKVSMCAWQGSISSFWGSVGGKWRGCAPRSLKLPSHKLANTQGPTYEAAWRPVWWWLECADGLDDIEAQVAVAWEV